MRTRITRSHVAGLAAAAAVVAGAAVAGATGGGATQAAPARSAEGAVPHATPAAKVVRLKDARLKFEINATDRDGGVQVFIDADSWQQMSIFDPAGKRIFRSTTSGRMAKQGGTELFLDVLPTDVVNAADRRPVPKRAVVPAPIVGPDPA